MVYIPEEDKVVLPSFEELKEVYGAEEAARIRENIEKHERAHRVLGHRPVDKASVDDTLQELEAGLWALGAYRSDDIQDVLGNLYWLSKAVGWNRALEMVSNMIDDLNKRGAGIPKAKVLDIARKFRDKEYTKEEVMELRFWQ